VSLAVDPSTLAHLLCLANLGRVYHLAIEDEDAAVGVIASVKQTFCPPRRSGLGVNTSLMTPTCPG